LSFLHFGKDTAANEEQTPWWRPILLLNATHDRARRGRTDQSR
jgi:hypothetical protein